MKIKLFTHTDLDGIGCAILGQLCFKDIDIDFCNYDDINEKVTEFVQSGKFNDYNFIYITDISVNEHVADMIDNLVCQNHLRLIDHHPTALWLNKYEWAKVTEFTHQGDSKTSGTFEFYLSLLGASQLGSSRFDLLMDAFEFVELVRRYDTWEWKTKYNDLEAKQLNDLFGIKGRDRFVTNVTYQLAANREFSFSEDDISLIEQNQEKIDKYIESKDKTLVPQKIFHHPVGVVFAEQYHSELGNRLAELHPELDFIVIINPSQSVSYRTVKDDVDLSQIAKMFGGGGHPKAAGSPISEETRDKMIELVLQSGNWSCGG